MLFSTLKKNNIEKCPFTYWLNGRWFLQIVDGDSWNLYKKNKKLKNFFFRKTILSHFTFYAIFNIKKNIEKCPFTYWLNGRWFLQIVDGDSWNLYQKK